MTIVHAYAASEPKGRLVPYEYELGPLGSGEIDIRVESCGICHSDLSMLDNEWGMSSYPVVPSHEVVGIVAAVGSNVANVAIGQRVGPRLVQLKLYALQAMLQRLSQSVRIG
ncbi:alcohol dehydrogenase-like protein [Paraburkholderia silvatlantica]|uniref:Alcohol dehydrogenase-like protein n=1 Tax=Paraburkholderia silvatlantica TaxID=321895 RepID=A0A2V4TVM8_9BURK|nr:alcohol dehydrogenase catalytic domain-containing protein [Paraburkholderia silvatlantica]PYE25438.1 alcohol dehydrogenase-like protein [Paraburkholderia silvatlantica]